MEDSQQLLQQILARYGLASARTFQLHSYNNQVYRIESADQRRFSLDWIYNADNPAVRLAYGPKLPFYYESIGQRVE